MATVMTCKALEGLAVEPLPCSLPPFPHLKNGDNNTQHSGPKDKACEKLGQGTLFLYCALNVAS